LFDRAADRMQVIIFAAEQLRNEIDGLADKEKKKKMDGGDDAKKSYCNSLIDSIVQSATENFRLIDTSIRVNLSGREAKRRCNEARVQGP